MEWSINNTSVLKGLKHREFIESHFPIWYIGLDMLDVAVVRSWLQLVKSCMSSSTYSSTQMLKRMGPRTNPW